MTMTTEVAAERLGVSQRQVQRLIASGQLPARRTAGDAWLVDALSLNALARARPSRGRPWIRETAWAVLWELSGLATTVPTRRTSARTMARLGSMSPDALVHACRRRATPHRFRASESFLDALRDRVALTGPSATTVGAFEMDADLGRVDGYCSRASLDDLVVRFHLAPDERGNVTLRVVEAPGEGLLDRRSMPVAVVAVDLAESYEPRERTAGIRTLRRLLP
ncbi:MAG: helix-turn-helix domain-containing protein [Actinobacteria bacterium]|nr:helix-turn-helix domain-containing protein [Actinomycetota bacterium]